MSPKKPADIIIRVLKNAGVELKDDFIETVKEELENELDLVSADSIVSQEEYEKLVEDKKTLKKDLFELRKKKNELSDEVDRLKGLMDSGESDLKRENEVLKTKLGKMEPLNKSLLEDIRGNWDLHSKSVPEDEKIRGKFKWPEKEGDMLSDEDVIANWKTFKEYRDLGVPGFDGKASEGPTPPVPPRTPPGGPGPKGAENLEGKSSRELYMMGIQKKEG